MDRLRELAERVGQCVSLTYDPTAPTPSEAWVASVGLDSYAAGESAEGALIRALEGLRSAGCASRMGAAKRQ